WLKSWKTLERCRYRHTSAERPMPPIVSAIKLCSLKREVQLRRLPPVCTSHPKCLNSAAVLAQKSPSLLYTLDLVRLHPCGQRTWRIFVCMTNSLTSRLRVLRPCSARDGCFVSEPQAYEP